MPKHLRVIYCSGCNQYFHVKCCNINRKRFNSLLLANKSWNCKNCSDNNGNLNSSLHDYISNLDGNEVSENHVPEKNRKCGKCLKVIARNLNPICCNLFLKSFHIKCMGLGWMLKRM